jgi:endogenous inhibitor of DNA gyrase (YacG/DUF329 family)
MPDSAGANPPARPCPICGKPPIGRYRPFCSARCGQVDLGRWLGERYAVETDDAADDRQLPSDGLSAD